MLVLVAAVIIGALRHGMWPAAMVGGVGAVMALQLLLRFRLRTVDGPANWPAPWPSLVAVSCIAVILGLLGVVIAAGSLVADR